MEPVPELADCARACARRLADCEELLLASHIDADGLTSAAIASKALERAGISHAVVFKKQLDETEIADIAARPYETVLFTDFGSGQLDMIAEHERAGDFQPVIADHHQPADASTKFHLNPLLFGINGASELSGAGTTYVLARHLSEVIQADGGEQANKNPHVDSAKQTDGDPQADSTKQPDAPAVSDNRDLAALAVVGAVGDMQAGTDGLTGANRGIVEEGIDAGVISEQKDLALYGKQTRPLPKLLEYSSDIGIPGISNDQQGSISFLDQLELETHEDGDWRRWVDLSDGERQTLVSALLQRAITRGVPPDKAQQLIGTSYTLPQESSGTELRDASEFSTLLNATARYERGDVGLAVCLGDRTEALSRAKRLLRNHRRNLSEGIQRIKEQGVTLHDHIQSVDAGDTIRETIVGIVAGMALGSDGIPADRPIFALAEKNEDEHKVSARGTGRLVGEGLDLSAVIGEAARAVGGDGGGHDIAAGATIPKANADAFLAHADALVGEQLGKNGKD